MPMSIITDRNIFSLIHAKISSYCSKSVQDKFQKDAYRADVVIILDNITLFEYKDNEQEIKERVFNSFLFDKIIFDYLSNIKLKILEKKSEKESAKDLGSEFNLDTLSIKRFINQAALQFVFDSFIENNVLPLMEDYSIDVIPVSSKFWINIKLNSNGNIIISAESSLDQIKVLAARWPELNNLIKTEGQALYLFKSKLEKKFRIEIKVNLDGSFEVIYIQNPNILKYNAANKTTDEDISLEEVLKYIDKLKKIKLLSERQEIQSKPLWYGWLFSLFSTGCESSKQGEQDVTNIFTPKLS